MIHRFSCIQVRTHHCKFHGIFCVGLTVKNIQFPGQFIISEFPAVYISCGDPVPDACKSFILAVLFVIAKNSSDLPGLIIASKNSSSRYAHRTVCVNLIFHQNIDHTGCIQASHTAALHNNTEFFQLCFFHLFVLCILSGRLCCPYAVIFYVPFIVLFELYRSFLPYIYIHYQNILVVHLLISQTSFTTSW